MWYSLKNVLAEGFKLRENEGISKEMSHTMYINVNLYSQEEVYKV